DRTQRRILRVSESTNETRPLAGVDRLAARVSGDFVQATEVEVTSMLGHIVQNNVQTFALFWHRIERTGSRASGRLSGSDGDRPGNPCRNHFRSVTRSFDHAKLTAVIEAIRSRPHAMGNE